MITIKKLSIHQSILYSWFLYFYAEQYEDNFSFNFLFSFLKFSFSPRQTTNSLLYSYSTLSNLSKMYSCFLIIFLSLLLSDNREDIFYIDGLNVRIDIIFLPFSSASNSLVTLLFPWIILDVPNFISFRPSFFWCCLSQLK